MCYSHFPAPSHSFSTLTHSLRSFFYVEIFNMSALFFFFFFTLWNSHCNKTVHKWNSNEEQRQQQQLKIETHWGFLLEPECFYSSLKCYGLDSPNCTRILCYRWRIVIRQIFPINLMWQQQQWKEKYLQFHYMQNKNTSIHTWK